nr:prepilin-type N-terminal cleavage/methylation domain-containing protein [Bacteriovorax sp. HI3]
MKQNKGFSLVEIMIAAAALAGLAYVGLQLTKTQTKSVAKNSFDNEVSMITNEINGLLSDPAVCLATLISTTTPTNINSKYYIKTDSNAPANGYGNANIKINSYAFSGAAPDGVLDIRFNNKAILKGTAGAAEVIKKINITYTGAPGAVTSCRATSTGTSDIWLRGTGANINNIYYNNGNVGVGTTSPTNAKLEVAGTIRPGAVTVGSGCAVIGAQGYNSSNGQPAYCDGSVWKNSGGGAGDVTIVNGSVSSCRGVSTAYCPAGHTVVGGGYTFNASCGCPEEHRFATQNYPSSTTSWSVSMECATSTAYAVCMKK